MPKRTWTENEEKVLIENFYNYSDLELHQMFLPNKSPKAIERKIFRLNLGKKSPDVKQRGIEKMANTKKEYYKTHDGFNKGKIFSKETRQKMSIAKTSINKWKGEDNPRHKNPLNGELNGRWKGGILDTYLELRSETKDWFNESLEFCGYKCVITGGEFDNVHHTTAFRDIVDEVFELTKIEVRPKVCDYSVEEFEELRSVLKGLHILYGFGACINKDVHKLFHDNYGYTKFTPYDFLDFVYKLDCGEFDEFLLENNIKLKINYEYIEYLESTLLSLESA